MLQISYTSGNAGSQDASNFLHIRKPWVVEYPNFLSIGIQGHFRKVIPAPLHSFLKIRKSHRSTGLLYFFACYKYMKSTKNKPRGSGPPRIPEQVCLFLYTSCCLLSKGLTNSRPLRRRICSKGMKNFHRFLNCHFYSWAGLTRSFSMLSERLFP